MCEKTSSPEQQQKQEVLKDYLLQLESVAVAFSGSVDSTYLLKIAHGTQSN